ncbi:hypothetical protein [Persicobacter psychrovividus]|uniref:Uncharacterized protein n=1 Tax=Persicobacter psychrovividus TaxID=387638 RepID=A0ABM7VK08_9BACT|nr:hypothetical protein PEPS_36000 [Persicobacter psychrovividus]
MKIKIRYYILLFLLTISACQEHLKLPDTPYFLTFMGNYGQDEAIGILADDNEQLYIAGNLSKGKSIYWTQLNAFGHQQWHLTWGDSSQQHIADWQLNSTHLFATGHIVDQHRAAQLSLWKMNKTSGQLESLSYPSELPYPTWGQKIQLLENGGLLLAGNYALTTTQQGALFLLLDPQGELLWQQSYSQLQAYDQIIDMRQNEQGYQVIGNIIAEGKATIRTIQLNDDGEILWAQTLRDQPTLEAVAVHWHPSEIRLLATEKEGEQQQTVVLKLTAKGQLKNKITLTAEANNTAADLLAVGDHYFVLRNVILDTRQTNALVEKYDAQFNLIWQQQYGSDWQDDAQKLFARSTGPGFLATVNFDNKNENANTKIAIYALDQEGVLR